MARASVSVFLGVCAIPALTVAQTPPAASPVSSTLTLVSDYVYRGLTNTSGDPAIQGSFDYSNPAGFYAGVWGSNSSWISDGYAPGSSHSIEIDLYTGWRFKLPKDFTLEAGYQRYAFPGRAPPHGYAAGTTRPDTDEVHLAGGWRWITLSYYDTLSDAFGNADSVGSGYLDLTLAVPLADSGFTLTTLAGRQRFRGVNAAAWAPSTQCTNRCLSYTDYFIGVGKSWYGLDFALAFTHTNARARAFDGAPVYLNRFGDNVGENHWIFSVQKSF